MAELNLYKCKKCGWEIETPSDGTDFLMDSIMSCYVCHDCHLVFKKYYALGTVFEGKVSCPQCKGYNTQDWGPNDRCPKCGGELENQGITCLMD